MGLTVARYEQSLSLFVFLALSNAAVIFDSGAVSLSPAVQHS